MAKVPPKEGARWGNDPAPKPVLVPAAPLPPEGYLELCEQYGEPNVQKALAIHERVKLEAPHIQAVKNDKIDFASSILRNSQQSMDHAARDGRAHTLPETLKIMDDVLAGFLLQNPDWKIEHDCTITYGDENKGKVATKKKEAKENNKIIGQLALIIGGPSIFFGWLASLEPGGLTFGGTFIASAFFIGAGLAVLAVIGHFFDE